MKGRNAWRKSIFIDREGDILVEMGTEKLWHFQQVCTAADRLVSKDQRVGKYFIMLFGKGLFFRPCKC